MNRAIRVAGVVHDPGDHPGSRRAGVGPDMLINAERVHAGQSVLGPDAPRGFCLDGGPGCVPGDAELVGQGRDRGIEMLQRVRRPGRSAGSEFRPRSGQRMILGECRSRAARVRAAPDTFGPQQPHRPPEAGDVMEPDLPASVPDRDDAALRAAGDVLPGFDVQNQSGRGCRDGADVDALDTEQRVRTSAPAAIGTRHRVIHVRVSFGYWLLGRYQFKEALTLSCRTTPHRQPPARGGILRPP